MLDDINRFQAALCVCRPHASQHGSLALMRTFPKGCCKVASMLLSRFLVDIGSVNPSRLWIICNGEDDKGRTHAWVETESHLIDITGNQFDDALPLLSEDRSLWYCRFRSSTRWPYPAMMQMNDAYQKEFDYFYQVVRTVAEGRNK
jgi:hypothetical protein